MKKSNLLRSFVCILVMLTFLTTNVIAYADIGQMNENKNEQEDTTKDKTKDKELIEGSKKRIIVKYKDMKKEKDVAKAVKDELKLSKIELKKEIKSKKVHVYEISEKDSLKNTIKEFEKDKNVEYVQEDYLLELFDMPSDPEFSSQWGLYNDGQVISSIEGTSGVDINAINAWQTTKGSEEVVVAVVDTGVDIYHNDLENNIYDTGYDFANNDESVYDSSQDDLHGTHVAGIIAAKENEIGICGAAPNVKILPVKFIDGNYGYTSDAINAIAYAEDMGASIANFSWGGVNYNQALKDAMEDSSMLFVCAAGNNGLDTSDAPIYPANFDLPNVISVGALDNRGSLASFSSYGDGIDVAAPGKEIISTLPEGNYGKLSGSSMAAPFVAGVAALLKSEEPDITASEMAERIRTNVVVSPKLSGKVLSGGRVDADAVLKDIIPPAEEDGLPEPTPTPTSNPTPGGKNIENFIDVIESNSLEVNDKEMKPVIVQNNMENVGSRDISFPLDNGLDTTKSDIDPQTISPLAYIYEEGSNDTSSAAMPVGIGTIFATIDSLDESNWFTVYLEENRDYTIRLTGLYEGYDMDLFLYKPNLSYAAHSSNFGNADEIININPTESGYYYINTYSFEYAGDENNTYQLLIYPDDTPPDQHEPNDCMGTATPIGLDTDICGTINISTDDDWYVVNADKGRLTVSLDSIPSGCDYDVVVYDENMTFIGGSWNSGNLSEKASVFLNESADYYIRVYSYIGSHASNEYRLNVINSRPDIHELNDFYYQAAEIYLGTSIFGTIDSEFDTDWYSIDIEEAGNYSLKLQDIPQGCDYDLIVYDSELQHVGHSFNWGNEDEEVNVSLDSGVYYAYIYSYSGASDENLYRFSVSNENALTLELPRVRGNPGETIQVPVNISDLPPEGISALSFGVGYNKDVFTYLGYEAGQLTDSPDADIAANETSSGIRVFYSDDTNTYTAPLVGDGELIKFNFQINSQARESAYTLGYLPGWSFTKIMSDGSVEGEDNVLFKIGVVSVGDFELNSTQAYQQPQQYTNLNTEDAGLGDINGDGKIDTIDYTLLSRHVLEVNTIDENSLWKADLNGDGYVNSTDCVVLKMFMLEIIDVFPAAKEISLSTENQYPEVGDIITVSLDINNINNFAGYQVNIKYDPLVLEPVDYNTEQQFSKDTMPEIGNILNSSYDYVDGAYHNLGEGRLNFGRAVKSLSSYKNSGSAETTGNLAKIKFKVLKEANTTIEFKNDNNNRYQNAEEAVIKQKDAQLFDWNGNSINIDEEKINKRNLTLSTTSGEQTSMSEPLEYEELDTTGTTLSYETGQQHTIVGYLGVSNSETFDIELFDGGKENILGKNGNSVNIYSDGYFEINYNRDSNEVLTLRISKEGYLSRLINVYTGMYGIQLGTLEEPLEMWEGDTNGDYVIDMEDIMTIIKDLDDNGGIYSENDLNNALDEFNRTSEDYPLEMILTSSTTETSHYIEIPKNTVLNLNNKVLVANGIQNWGTIHLNGGQLYLEGGYTQKENALVSDSTPLIDMEDGYMEVGGNILMDGGTMFMNGGTLYAKSEYQLKNNSALRMINDSDYLIVEKFIAETETNFETDSEVNTFNNCLVAGELVLLGDFTINSSNTDFEAAGIHRTILPGLKEQTINFENVGYEPHIFNILTLYQSIENYNFIPKGNVFWRHLIVEDIERRKGIDDGKHAPTGEYVKNFVDMTSEAPGFEVVFSRKYNSHKALKDIENNEEGSFGEGWTFGFDSKIEYNENDYGEEYDNYHESYYEVELPDGMSYSFIIKGDEYISYNTRATLEKNGNTLTLTTKDQYKYFYVGNDIDGYVLNKMVDGVGNYITIEEDENNDKIIKDITGKQYKVIYDSQKITGIQDIDKNNSEKVNREVVYSYTGGKLETVTYPMGKVIEYGYNNGLLTVIKNKVSENVYETIETIGYVNNKMKTLTDEYGAVKEYTYNDGETIIIEKDSYDNELRKTVLEYDFSLLVNQKSIYRYENGNEILHSENSVFYTGNRMFAEEREIVDINGNTTTYRRDDNGNIIKIINPDGSEKEFGYDLKNNMIWEKDEEGRFTRYEYSGNKLIRKAERIESLSPEDPIPDVSSINNQDYRITEYDYYNWAETPNHETTYGVYGLLEKEIVIMPEGDIITEYGYHENGKLAWIKNPETGQKTHYSEETYTNDGWEKTTTTPLGNVTEHYYNKEGQLVKEILRDNQKSSTSVIVYDDFGRKAQDVSPNLYAENVGGDLPQDIGYRYEYKGTSGLVSKITDPEDYVTEFEYDIFGNITRETRHNGSIYEYEYDVLGRLTKKSFRKNSASSPVVLEKYDYVQKVETGKGHYLYEKVHTKYFDTNNFAKTTYRYDYAGREVYRENADGGIVNTEYYKNGKVKSKSDVKNPDHKTLYNYDMYFEENGCKYNYDEKWTPFREDDNGTLWYAYTKTIYDRAGRVKKVEIGNSKDGFAYGETPQDTITTEYSYYKNGKVESVISNDQKVTTYLYDDDKNLEREIVTLDNNRTLETKYTYNYLGEVATKEQLVRKGDIFGYDFETANDKIYLVTEYEYDYNGNLEMETKGKTREVVPLGDPIPDTVETDDTSTTTYQYYDTDRQKRVIHEDVYLNEEGNYVNVFSQREYNWEGQIEYIRDFNGNYTEFIYDERGFNTRINKKGLFKSSTPITTTAFYYDLAGRLTAEVAPEDFVEGEALENMNRIEYDYDDMNRLLKKSYAGYEKQVNASNTGWAQDIWVEYVMREFNYDKAGNTKKEIDGRGNVTEYTYTPTNQVETVLSAEGKEDGLDYTRKFSYDTINRKVSELTVQDENTETGLWYYYDDDNNTILLKGGYDEQSAIELSKEYYDYDENLIAQMDGENLEEESSTPGSGKKTLYEYNGLNELRKVTYPGDGDISDSNATIPQREVNYQYDYQKRLKRQFETYEMKDGTVYNEITKVDLYNYDKMGRVLSHESYEEGNKAGTLIETIREYDKNGNIKVSIDGEGNETQYIYDELDRLEETVIELDNGTVHRTINGYDKNDNVETVTKRIENGTDWTESTNTFVYDSLNRLVEKQDAYNTIQMIEYYRNGLQKKSYDAPNNEGSNEFRVTEFVYDKDGRVIEVENPTNSQGASGVENITTYTYDYAGNVKTKNDGLNTTEYKYDEFNRLYEVKNSVLNEKTRYGYDRNDNMIRQEVLEIEDGNSHYTSFKLKTFEYNVRNQLSKTIYHTDKVWNAQENDYVYNSQTEDTYKYYANGSMREKTDRSGAITSYTYDVHGRLESQETEKTGSDIIKINHTYDKNNNTRIVRHKVNGITTDTIIRTYDGLNRVKAKSVSSIGIVSHTYDIIVNRTDIEQGLTAEMSQDPYGNITTKVYDKAGRLKNVIDGDASSGTLCATYEYNPNGSRRSLTYENGSKAEYTYWENGLLKKLVNIQGQSVIDEYNYEYDEAQNMESKTEIINNVNKGTTTYQYDELNRLKNVSEQDGARIINYTYDPAGNRETETIQMGTTKIESTYEYDGQDLLLSIDTVEKVDEMVQDTYQTSYQYDDNGNMTEIWKDSTLERKYEYDVLNRMTAVKNPDGSIIMESTYNGEGLRVSKTVGATTTEYLYEYRNVVLETSNGQETGRNIYGTNLVNRTVDQTDTLYYLYNGRGDVTSLIDTTGTVEGTYYYDSFGNILERTGNVDNSITYAGYQYDKETEIVENGEVVQTGLYYLNARMYDPNIARFLQQDTYTGDPRDPLSLNLYTYCHNEPIMYSDPTGYSREYKLPLRKEAEKYDSNAVAWNRNTKTATVTIGETTKHYNVRSDGKVYMDGKQAGILENGSIIVNRDHFYNIFDRTYSFDRIMENVERLYNHATNYPGLFFTSQFSPLELTLQYMRGVAYTDSAWISVAGELERDFIDFVNFNDPYMNEVFFTEKISMIDPLTKKSMDFTHFAATLNAIIYNNSNNSIYSLYNTSTISKLGNFNNSEVSRFEFLKTEAKTWGIGGRHISNLAGWAGDLQSLIGNLQIRAKSDDYTHLHNVVMDLIGDEDGKFGFDDILADTDAVNIGNMIINNQYSLIDAFNSYYDNGLDSGYHWRFRNFVKLTFGSTTDYRSLNNQVGSYTKVYFQYPFKWPLIEKHKETDPTTNQMAALRDAFSDYIWTEMLNERRRTPSTITVGP